MTLDEARAGIGRGVVYWATRRDCGGQLESGVITSVNETFVFVRYGAAKQSAATRPEDLEFE